MEKGCTMKIKKTLVGRVFFVELKNHCVGAGESQNPVHLQKKVLSPTNSILYCAKNIVCLEMWFVRAERGPTPLPIHANLHYEDRQFIILYKNKPE